MEIVVGKTAGFCFGVKNAVEKTREQLEKTSNLYCLGELVHNKQIIEDLEKSGLKIIETIEDAKDNSNLIIRAHGVGPEIYEIAKFKNISIVDLTCPKVYSIHEMAKKYKDENYYIFFMAERKHPEAIGTSGFCGNNMTLIENEEDIEGAIKNFENSNLKKTAVIAQTTFSVEKFDKIVSKIKNYMDENHIDIEINKTICNATQMRQSETEEMSVNVDRMIIIGGKNSANTKRLYDIASSKCKDTVLVQTKDDLENIEYIRKANKIGVMAGASTPKESIDGVIDFINNIELKGSF